MTLAELRAQAVRVWRYPPVLDDVWHTGTPLPNWLPSCVEGLWLPAPVAERLLALAEAVEAYGECAVISAGHRITQLERDQLNAMLAALAAVKDAGAGRKEDV